MTNGGTLTSQGLALVTLGTWTPGTGTVELTATNTLPASGFTTFNNVTLSGGTTTLGANATVNGKLSRQGTGTFANGGFTLTYGGSASLEYKGSGIQTTGVEFLEPMAAGVIIDNASGVTLGASRTVNKTLTLTSGLLTLGSNNLTLGSSATIGGTPAASRMIVTNGSGELRKVFAGTGSFTFPIGDNTGSAEYSPVTLNFTSGSFAGGAYAGARVTNAKDPNNTSTTDYLVRYWTMSSSGISGFSYNATYQYVPADVVGTER